jgi:NADH-quinone oxidoreductase subunit I
MEPPPHPMRLGETEQDYYLDGLSNPGTSAGAERVETFTGPDHPEPPQPPGAREADS